MYRLLNLWTLHNTLPFLRPVFVNPSKYNVNCSFCRKPHKNNLNDGAVRNQSTNTALQSISKKKRKKRAQKYLELLEVKNESTLQTKASVSNLSAKHLTLLMNQPEITLDELHKIRDVKKKSMKKKKEAVIETKTDTSSMETNSYCLTSVDMHEIKNSTDEYILENTFKDSELDIDTILANDHFEVFSDKIIPDSTYTEITGIEHGLLEEIENQYNVDKNENTNTITAVEENVKKKIIKKNNRLKSSLISEELIARDKVAREETLARLILSYTGLCVSQGKAQKALATLNFYCQRAKNSSVYPQIKDIRIYNCVLEGFAAKGNIGKVRDILASIEEEGIQKNIQTYLIVFECLGRMKPLPSVKTQLEIYQKEMNLLGFTLNDIMEKGKFIYDQRELVLSAIKHLQPNFVPQYTPPYIQYSCPLVNDLNHSDQVKFLNSHTCIWKNTKLNEGNISENKKITEMNNQQNEKFIPFSSSTDLIDLDNINLSSDFMQSSLNNLSDTLNNKTLNDIQESQNNNANENIQNCRLQSQESKSNIKINNLFTSANLKEYSRQQLQIEAQGYLQVKSIEKETQSSNYVQHLRKKLSETQLFWKNTIIECIKRDLNNLHAQIGAQGETKSATLQACLTALPIEELSQLVLTHVQKLAEGSETYSPTVGILHRELGSAVHSRYQVRLKIQTGILDKVGNVYDDYCDWYTNKYVFVSNKKIINPRQCWQSLVHAHRTGPSIDVEDRVWPNTMINAVGKFLYKIITKDLKIDVNVLRQNSKQSKLLPAFYTVFRSQGHLIKEELKAHPAVTKLYRGAASPYLTFTPNMLPMKCPPRPWVNAQSPGGYLVMHTDLIRLPPQAITQAQRLASIPSHFLYPALDSLNQLAAVPWTVNQEILDIAIQIFQNGGSSQLGVAQPPSVCLMPPQLPSSATKAEKYQAFKQRMAVKRKRGEMYSLWCDALYRFSLANHFRNDIFWLPHNMDFRGRVYPVPPHLTHLGADLARSLLVFAQPKPLGPDGLRWLKLHLINLTGTKKHSSLEERIKCADKLMPEILDSADNPLMGTMWWSKSEEPWQTLACCREIANAVRCPTPENYLSRFPVHQDGSCNGLQHYAALGRDAAGAKSVNLTPASEPQDVYAAVAELVEKQRKIDADSGHNIAIVLEGFVKRKVIKQTVMTTVYGVTRFGARLQIARQLKDIDEFPKEHVWAASSYLTARTFESIRTMFTSTREIQDWFTDCARLISGVSGQNVEWVTPLGLPIVQPYTRFRKIDCSQSSKKNKIPEHFPLDMFERPNVMKQKNAFPPNFIHSLDSSHMMLTSLFCENAGITFVSVHDCFWTHPINVSVMNKICREQFVALHSQPILQDLSNFLVNKYSCDESDIASNSTILKQNKRKLNHLLQKLPTTGDFQLENVLDSVYFFC